VKDFLHHARFFKIRKGNNEIFIHVTRKSHS